MFPHDTSQTGRAVLQPPTEHYLIAASMKKNAEIAWQLHQGIARNCRYHNITAYILGMTVMTTRDEAQRLQN
jgi:hypothetical protein